MKITGSSGLFPSLADLRLFGRTLKERLKDFSPLISFRLVPKTKAEWERFVLLPFKTYVVVTLPLVATVERLGGRTRVHLPMDLIMLGYLLCFIVLLCGGARQWGTGLRGQSLVTYLFVVLAFLASFAFYTFGK